MERTWSPLGPVLKLHLQQPGVNRNCQYFEFGIGTGAVEYFFFSSFFFLIQTDLGPYLGVGAILI